jgi:signal transduction histidine kinase/DNA-binding response OmpR family regulator
MKVVIVEDDASLALLIKELLLCKCKDTCDLFLACTLAEGIKISGDADAVLLDLKLPDSDRETTLEKFRKSNIRVPVVILTAFDDEKDSIRALQSGAQDYIIKDRMDGTVLNRAIRYAIERKKITDSLEASRCGLDGVIDRAPVMMFVVDRTMKIMKVNRTALDYLNKDSGDVLGELLGETMRLAGCKSSRTKCGSGPECGKCVIRLIIMDSFETGNGFNRMELNNIKIDSDGGDADGACFFSISCVPLEFNGEKMMLVSFDDITIRRRSEEKMDEAMRKMREIDKLKSNFVAMVSHEIRTPITSVKAFTDFLLGGVAGTITQHQTEFLHVIKENVDRLVKLTDDLLDISKMESGTFSISRKPVELSGLSMKVIKNFSPLADMKKIRLTAEMPAAKITADADEFRIEQVINNLINNALKLSGEGSAIKLKLTSADSMSLKVPERAGHLGMASGKYAAFSVSDEGPGLEEEQLTKIFDRFYQVEGVERKVYKGVGLGLNIAENIVKAHNGAIWAESDGKDHGSEFKFVIPLPADV